MSSTISSAIEPQLPAWARGLSLRLPGRVSRDVAIPRLKSNVFLLFIYVWLRWGVPKFSLVPKRIVVGVISWVAGRETGQSAEYWLRLLGEYTFVPVCELGAYKTHRPFRVQGSYLVDSYCTILPRRTSRCVILSRHRNRRHRRGRAWRLRHLVALSIHPQQ